MAVMPSLSYSPDGSNLSPVTPHYSSKFMDSGPSSLDPNASVYQPLKKWLWQPHLMSQRTLSLSWAFCSCLSFYVELTGPDSFCTLIYHRRCAKPLHTYLFGSLFGSIMRTIILREVTYDRICFCWVLGFCHWTAWSDLFVGAQRTTPC